MSAKTSTPGLRPAEPIIARWRAARQSAQATAASQPTKITAGDGADRVAAHYALVNEGDVEQAGRPLLGGLTASIAARGGGDVGMAGQLLDGGEVGAGIQQDSR